MVDKNATRKERGTEFNTSAETLKLFFNEDYRQLIMSEWIKSEDDNKPIRYTRASGTRHWRRLQMVKQYFLQQGRDLSNQKVIDVLIDFAFTTIFAAKENNNNG